MCTMYMRQIRENIFYLVQHHHITTITVADSRTHAFNAFDVFCVFFLLPFLQIYFALNGRHRIHDIHISLIISMDDAVADEDTHTHISCFCRCRHRCRCWCVVCVHITHRGTTNQSHVRWNVHDTLSDESILTASIALFVFDSHIPLENFWRRIIRRNKKRFNLFPLSFISK